MEYGQFQMNDGKRKQLKEEVAKLVDEHTHINMKNLTHKKTWVGRISKFVEEKILESFEEAKNGPKPTPPPQEFPHLTPRQITSRGNVSVQVSPAGGQIIQSDGKIFNNPGKGH